MMVIWHKYQVQKIRVYFGKKAEQRLIYQIVYNIINTCQRYKKQDNKYFVKTLQIKTIINKEWKKRSSWCCLANVQNTIIIRPKWKMWNNKWCLHNLQIHLYLKLRIIITKLTKSCVPNYMKKNYKLWR